MEDLTDNPARARGAPSADDLSPEVLLDALPIPALLVRLNGSIVTYNAAAGQLFELTSLPDASHLRDLPRGRGPDLQSTVEEINRGFVAGEVVPAAVYVDLDWGVATLRPILGARGRALAILITAPGHIGDASEQRASRVEGALASRKVEFLAMLAHELRNPLAPILNALQFLRQKVKNDRAAIQAWKIADRQVRHQARLLDDLLDASRVVLGKIDLRMENVDLNSLLSRVVSDTGFMFQVRAQDVRLQLPDDPIVLQGDSPRLEQVFRNLLSNAGKYTGPGGKIAVDAEREEGGAVVRVRDTGIGIEPDILPRIFDLFVQADTSLARSEGGLGIGLTLVQHLVRLHGGNVLARSEGRGRGSEFEVHLPRGMTVPATVEADPTAAQATRSRRILLIEDNRDSRQMLRMLLELNGHRVDDAADGLTGIKLAAEYAPEVALIDIGLPDVDGYAVAERIRKLLGAQVRLIALTGYGDPEARRRTAVAGFDLHLVKPVPPEELARSLEP